MALLEASLDIHLLFPVDVHIFPSIVMAYLYNTYGALIAEGAEDDIDGQIYWRRYFTGQKLLKYSKKAKDDFYTITVE